MLSKNIFTLVENPNDLPSSNENMADMYYREIIPTRNITDIGTSTTYSSQFGGNPIQLRWMLDNRTWWLPSRSYLRIELELTKPDGTNLVKEDEIAPNMGIGPSLFNQIHFKMNDVSVCHINQFIGQCDALAKRVYQTSEWLDRNVGNDTGFWNPHFSKRQQDLIVKGNAAEEVIVTEKSNFIVLTRDQLGLGQTQSGQANWIKIVVANTGILTISSIGSAFLPKLKDIFEPGDLLSIHQDVLESAGVQGKWYTYMVLDIISDTTMQLGAISGTTIPKTIDTEANGGSGYQLQVWRHRGLCKSVKYVLSDNAESQVSSFVTTKANAVQVTLTVNTHTVTFTEVGNTEYIGGGLGDFYFSWINGNASYNGGMITDFQTALIIHVGFPLAGWQAGRAAAVSDIYSVNTGWKTVNLNDGLGYDAGVNLVRIYNGYIMEIVKANPTEISAYERFLPGDFIYMKSQAGAFFGAFIHHVISDSDVLTELYLSASEPMPDMAQNQNNNILQLYRYCPESKLLNVGNKSKLASKFDLNWKPSCLSIFNYPGAIPGGCKFELEVQGNNQFYQGFAIETPPGINKVARNASAIGSADYQLLVKSLKFYVCTVTGPVVGEDQYSYYLNLNEIRAHTRVLNTTSLTQTAIDVTPSSYALALAFQDKRSETAEDTSYSVTKFHVGLKDELYLSRYSIRFAGLSLPQPDAQLAFKKEGQSIQNYLNNHYMRNQLYLNQYYKTTGGESYADWVERGVFFYHPFIRSAGNKEGRAYVITQFDEQTNGKEGFNPSSLDQMSLFLFEFYRSFAYIRISKGNVYEVRTAIQ